MKNEIKFWMRVLVLAITTFIAGCGGSGGDSNPIPGTGNQTTATTNLGPSGGNITLANDVVVTLDANILKQETTVSVEKYENPLTAVAGSTAISETFVLNLSAEVIASSTETNESYITFKIPIKEGNNKSSAPSPLGLDYSMYNTSRVVLDINGEKVILSGNYFASDGKSTIRVAKSTILDIEQQMKNKTFNKAEAGKTDVLKFEVVSLNYSGCFEISYIKSELYQVKSEFNFSSMLLGLELKDKTPLILIHGWQGGKDSDCLKPHEEAWKNFLKFYYASSELQAKFSIFSYRYDTDKKIEDNAKALKDKLNLVFGKTKVVLLAHSMGGLIAHAYIQNHNGAEKVLSLVSLGTPYHGTPMVQYIQNLVLTPGFLATGKKGLVLGISPFLVMKTPGTLDLAWDNFDENPRIQDPNTYLLNLNQKFATSDLSSIYTAFAGSLDGTSSHGFYGNGKTLKALTDSVSGYLNDGVVPMVSAFNQGWSPLVQGHLYRLLNENVMNDYDHSQMSDGKCLNGFNDCGQDILFDKIKSQLLAIVTPKVISLSAGVGHTCTVLEGGSIKCWGYNFHGQLGNGTTINSSLPVAVSNISNAILVSAGEKSSCALIADQTVKCWGHNFYGQLGNGNKINSSLPVTVQNISNAIGISVGSGYACALLTNQTVKCWGRNDEGQLGNGTRTDSSLPVFVPNISNVVGIASNADHACAILTDQTFKCWGGLMGLTPITITVTGSSVSGVSASLGIDYFCILLEDGNVKCWGGNDYGQLGDGTRISSSSPVVVQNLSTAVAISASAYHTCAILADYTVKCWGNNDEGQLGNGRGLYSISSIPVSVLNISNAVAISAGAVHSCAVLVDQAVKCWGRNDEGELGDGTTINSNVPVAVRF